MSAGDGSEFWNRCLSEEQMLFGNSLPSEAFLQRYVILLIAVFGILGNTLNLTVLLDRTMRNRANCFLAALAIADILFLLLVLPNVLANYEIFTFNYYFRYFYLISKAHLLSLANWSSAVAIWCVIAVCTDRLAGILWPLKVRYDWPGYGLPILLMGIISVTGALTVYQHFEYECRLRQFCYGTQIFGKCMRINGEQWFGRVPNPNSQSLRSFIDISIIVNSMAVIIFPIILLAVLNLILLCVLRRRSNQFMLVAQKNRRSMDATYQKTEQRVTLTVSLIVTSFTLTNGPSAAVKLLQTAYGEADSEWYQAKFFCSLLVICGKSINFILFCLSSRHFRQRLLRITKHTVHQKLERVNTLVLDRTFSRRKSSSQPSFRVKFSTATLNEKSSTSLQNDL